MKLAFILNQMTSKWFKVLDLKAKTVKLLEENIEENFYDIEFGNNFMDMIPKRTGNNNKNR